MNYTLSYSACAFRASDDRAVMTNHNEPTKTLGPRAATLFTELNERRRTTFTVSDVQAITGGTADAARSLIYKARRRGLIAQLKPGLYNLVPFELGRQTHHVSDPYLIARDAVRGAPYFLSFATAFELHRMATQPNLVNFVSSTRRMRAQTIGGYQYQFVFVPETRMFGVAQHWITKDQAVAISDLERTIIDGLRLPAYVGGITEVAKGLWMKRDKLSVEQLIAYARRLGVGAVIRRLGFLLESYQLADAATLDCLRAELSNTYHRFDPVLPDEGVHIARWRLRLNVTREELDAARVG